MEKAVKKLDLKQPEDFDMFLKSIVDLGFRVMHDPLYGYLYIKGDLTLTGFEPDGKGEINIIDDNKYLKTEINRDDITVTATVSDPVQGIKIRKFVLKKDVKIRMYPDFGYLSIEY